MLDQPVCLTLLLILLDILVLTRVVLPLLFQILCLRSLFHNKLQALFLIHIQYHLSQQSAKLGLIPLQQLPFHFLHLSGIHLL